MKKHFLIILVVLFIFISKSILYAQSTPCPYTPEELAQFGPWICPDYNPSNGFPGNPNAAVLQEVTIPRWNDLGIPNVEVVIPAVGGGGGVFVYNYFPCAGDPMRNVKIAPSSPGNYKGGTYGYTRNGGTKFHDGVDVAAPRGVNLYSMHAGQVVEIRNSFSPGQYAKSSYGNFITIKSTINGSDVYLKYNHMDGVNTNLVVGSVLNQGAYIGISGSTGNAASPGVVPHVHIQAKNQSSQKTDPLPYFGTQINVNTGVGTSPCN